MSFHNGELVERTSIELETPLGTKETEALGKAEKLGNAEAEAEAESGAALGTLEADSGRAMASLVSSRRVEHDTVTLDWSFEEDGAIVVFLTGGILMRRIRLQEYQARRFQRSIFM